MGLNAEALATAIVNVMTQGKNLDASARQTMQDAWLIISAEIVRHIQTFAVVNVPPATITGVSPSGPVTGTTTPVVARIQ